MAGTWGILQRSKSCVDAHYDEKANMTTLSYARYTGYQHGPDTGVRWEKRNSACWVERGDQRQRVGNLPNYVKDWRGSMINPASYTKFDLP